MTASLTPNRRAQSRWFDRLLPPLGILLVTGGLVLLGGYAWLLLTPDEAPYRYQLAATGKVDDYPDLELEAWPDLTINQYDIHLEGTDQPIAQAWFGQRANQPQVLLNWKNETREPLLALDQKAAELSALATAIDKYAPRDALLLSWWDTSRQLALLTGRDVLFHSTLHEPLIVPPEWQAHAQAIRAYENEQTGAAADPQERELFLRFTQSLLNPLASGLADLRQLAGTRDAYLIVHISDLYKLGLLYPDKFGIAYKPYRLTGNLHGMISHVKTEMSNHGYYAYTVQSLSDELIRAFFLTDEASYHTLLARLLPFTSQPSPLELASPRLIYQQGGYWVYQLAEKAPAAQTQHNLQPAPDHDKTTDSTHLTDQVQ
ncbi:hydroxylamine oxidation protein HaoB [Nitrosomonas eutropha]|uniref:Hydroxylamine oxidation protein HaoB n=1 Tax=Nitrosomonas eutropha (strain DSM 101675 / C91 / Nm57) TaxID=335283 RepID=Q0AF56_NITEC|nr:hydroxylamine oxidation protein HaoB [Nitrosomonas eutropha]ABI60026.1 conserved hypothetical protein [Nitrosomonas eutropha C91]SEJ34833.1 hydroxylamine oxidation protein HaoB [Nitrosomonas eutropha]